MSDHADFVVVGLGALGSAAAMELALRGHSVIGLERFELGHSRGASHDTSRILRHSYHTPEYVRLTQQAYEDWARLERDSASELVTVVGGLDLFPPEPAISPVDYTDSLHEVGIAYEVLDTDAVAARWPQFRLPDGTLALYQADSAIVPAGRGTRVMQDQARRHGADLRERTAVLAVRDLGERGIEVSTTHGPVRCQGLVVCADAWVNDVLADLGVQVPVEVTLEQVTYFRPDGTGWLRPEPDAAVDLDGRPVVLRVPLLRRAHGQGSSGLRWPGRPPGPAYRGAGPGDGTPARRARAGDAAGQRRPGALAALPVHADPGPRLRDLAGARPRVRGGRSRCGARLQVRADVRPVARRPGRAGQHAPPTWRRSGWTARP